MNQRIKSILLKNYPNTSICASIDPNVPYVEVYHNNYVVRYQNKYIVIYYITMQILLIYFDLHNNVIMIGNNKVQTTFTMDTFKHKLIKNILENKE